MPDEVLSGWGRSVWSRCHVASPQTADEVHTLVETESRSLIARGLGRSYGDQAINSGDLVIKMTGVTGPTPVPKSNGTITVSAGLSVEALLNQIVSLGWFIPVSAGTRYITIGGAIAADIHGKNHHSAGSFCEHVRSITLVLPDGQIVRCSPTQDSELFWATAGGMGLTGIILEATIQLIPIKTSWVLTETHRYRALEELLTAMTGADDSASYSVAWIDLMHQGKSVRSIHTTGRLAGVEELPNKLQHRPLNYSPTNQLAHLDWMPNTLLRPVTMKGFNRAWFLGASAFGRDGVQTIRRFFHPLDRVGNWNRLYGPNGFLQWQMVVPDGAESMLKECITALTTSPKPCFLAVIKRFRGANPGPLSFPIAGWTLSADLPAGSPELLELLDNLDRRVANIGGRIYLAKDARMNPALLDQMYPRLDEWRAVRDRVDPNHVLCSDMSRRLGL